MVAFKGIRDPDHAHVRDKEKEQHYDAKLNEAFCRAKPMVLQYALCNPWEYFFTGTLDKTKFNRYDLDEYHRKLIRWYRPALCVFDPIQGFLPPKDLQKEFETLSRKKQ